MDNRVLDRFWRSVEKTDDCWLWRGPDGENGYGSFYDGGKKVRAHRASWALHHGAIPAELSVLHKCDNPRCIRPEHLFLGTQLDNMRDRKSKGRYNHRGENHPQVRLTEKQVREIRSYRAAGAGLWILSMMFDVTMSTISNICVGKTWSHLQGSQ